MFLSFPHFNHQELAEIKNLRIKVKSMFLELKRNHASLFRMMVCVWDSLEQITYQENSFIEKSLAHVKQPILAGFCGSQMPWIIYAPIQWTQHSFQNLKEVMSVHSHQLFLFLGCQYFHWKFNIQILGFFFL